MPAMAHVARRHRYLQGLMRHLQSQIQSLSAAVVEEEARSLSKRHKGSWRWPFPPSSAGSGHQRRSGRICDLLQTAPQEPSARAGDVLLPLAGLQAHPQPLLSRSRGGEQPRLLCSSPRLPAGSSGPRLPFRSAAWPPGLPQGPFHFCPLDCCLRLLTSCLSDTSRSARSAQGHLGLRRRSKSRRRFAREHVDRRRGERRPSWGHAAYATRTGAGFLQGKERGRLRK